MEKRELIGKVREIPENVDETRKISFIASDDTVDRHGTVLNVFNWEIEAFNANPIIGWQHNVYGDAMCGDPSPDSIIGKGFAYIIDNKLMVDITFEKAENNPLAEKVFNKIKDGILNAVSVGFVEMTEGKMGQLDLDQDPNVYYFDKVELLEVSVVSIPSNKNALRKELRSQTYDALKYIYKQLGEDYRMSDIEQMKVRDVMDLIEGKKPKTKEVKTEIKKIYRVKKKLITADSEATKS